MDELRIFSRAAGISQIKDNYLVPAPADVSGLERLYTGEHQGYRPFPTILPDMSGKSMEECTTDAKAIEAIDAFVPCEQSGRRLAHTDWHQDSDDSDTATVTAGYSSGRRWVYRGGQFHMKESSDGLNCEEGVDVRTMLHQLSHPLPLAFSHPSVHPCAPQCCYDDKARNYIDYSDVDARMVGVYNSEYPPPPPMPPTTPPPPSPPPPMLPPPSLPPIDWLIYSAPIPPPISSPKPSQPPSTPSVEDSPPSPPQTPSARRQPPWSCDNKPYYQGNCPNFYNCHNDDYTYGCSCLRYCEWGYQTCCLDEGAVVASPPPVVSPPPPPRLECSLAEVSSRQEAGSECAKCGSTVSKYRSWYYRVSIMLALLCHSLA